MAVSAEEWQQRHRRIAIFYTPYKWAEIRWDEKVDPDHGWR